MPSRFSDADRRLWEAVSSHARETGAAPPRTVLVFDSDGGGRQLFPDGRSREWDDEVPAEPGAFPPAEGWGFRCGEASHRGRAFRLGGLKRRLLRALADRAGDPVPDRLVKLRVWGEADAGDDRLKDLVYQLRATLRAALSLADDVDPVERVEGGYRLALR